MTTKRLTMAQAIIGFLKNQHVERDGREQQFFAGVLGIFGHGNIAGIGQALQQNPRFSLYPYAQRARIGASRSRFRQDE